MTIGGGGGGEGESASGIKKYRVSQKMSPLT